MTYSLTWLPDVLLKAGLKVAPVDGWQYRGHGDMGALYGILCHHTAGAQTLNMPSLNTLVQGRPDLSGPLAHLGLGRDGTYYVIAAGRCNHAGAGSWKGIAAGNTHFLGIEAENTGLQSDPWAQIQMEAYHFGFAAILSHLGRGAEWCAGHKEYALPQGRKTDPGFDMAAFRATLAGIGQSDQPPSIVREAPPSPNCQPGRPTLRRGNQGNLVTEVQDKVGISPADGIFGPAMEAAVRAYQRAKSLVPDGIVGPGTWQAMENP